MKDAPQNPEGDDRKASGVLLQRLRRAHEIIHRQIATARLIGVVPWICGLVIVAFGADVVLHLQPQWRVAWNVVIVLVLVVAAGIAAWIRWFTGFDAQRTARTLESRDAALGSKLINVLQLEEQARDQRVQPLTRQLAAEAVERDAATLGSVNLENLAQTDAVRTRLRSTGWILAGWMVVLAVFFGIVRVEAPRFLDPYGDHPPYSFTRLEIADPAADGTRVVYGQGIVVTAKSGGHRPADVFMSFYPEGKPEAEKTLPMFDKGNAGFAQEIQPVQADMVVYAHTKNRHAVSKKRHISVVLTPKLEEAIVEVRAPEYTALRPQSHVLDFKILKALEGSKLRFTLRSNRPLREGSVEVIAGNSKVEVIKLATIAANQVEGTITASESARLRFALEDIDRFKSAETWETALSVIHDLGPEIEVVNPRGDAFVASDFNLQAQFDAKDDYGLKKIRIHHAINDQWQEPRVSEYPLGTLNASASLPLDISKMPVKPGDTISFFAEATDTAPAEHIARSKTVILTVITPQQYNDYLRQQTDISDVQSKYADLVRQIRDLAKEQEELAQESQALREELKKAQTPEAKAALANKLDKLLAKQNELNAKINKQAEAMEKFVRKDPLYDIEAQLQAALQREAERVKESAAANSKSASEVGQRSSPPEGRNVDEQMLAEFKEAADKQAEALGGTSKAVQDEAVAPLEDMSLVQEILKDINRFKALHEAQRSLVQHAAPYNKPGALPREDQLALRDLAALEKTIGDELASLEDKLWEDGKAAEKKFPKAAQSAKDLADQMGDLRLQSHAANATDAMLAANGQKSLQLSDQLRTEMEKLFSECSGKSGESQSEMDQYLNVSRGMSPGNSFEQMMQCRKFGSGNKPGKGMGSGVAGEGSDGFAVMEGPNASVLGNETAISQPATRSGNGGHAQVKPLDPKVDVSGGSGDPARQLNPVNRQSDAIQGEAPIEQYRDLVEKYFRAITK